MRWTSSPFSQRSETSQARADGVGAARQRPSHAFVSEKSEWVAARAYESLPFASKVMHPPALPVAVPLQSHAPPPRTRVWPRFRAQSSAHRRRCRFRCCSSAALRYAASFSNLTRLLSVAPARASRPRWSRSHSRRHNRRLQGMARCSRCIRALCRRICIGLWLV